MRLSQVLYRLARASSWAEAGKRGPRAAARKAARRPVYRAAFRGARRITKGLGL